MKTRQQKWREALARREADYTRWLGKWHAEEDPLRKQSLEQKADRASFDIKNLKLRLGMPA